MDPPESSASLKLRSACDHCHLSKVRCSGEKTGCRRCRHGGRTCHYSASNMGKVAGDRRHKRKSIRLRLEDCASVTEGSEGLGPTALISETLSPSVAPDLSFWPQLDREQESRFADFTNDLDGLEFMNDIGLASSTNLLSTAEEFSEIDFSTSSKSQIGLLSPNDGTTRSFAPSSSSSVSTTPLSVRTDSQNTKDLTACIQDLSKKLSESPLALDEVLCASTSYLQSIDAALAKLSDDSSRTSIILMIIICLTQILALFEECICPSAITMLFDTKSGPTLRLGNFQVDPESQRRFRIQIVRDHLLLLFNVAKQVRRALQQNLVVADLQTQTYLTLVAGIQGRIKLLSHAIP